MNTKKDTFDEKLRFLTPHEIRNNHFEYEMMRVGQFLGQKRPCSIDGTHREEIISRLRESGWKVTPVPNTSNQFIIGEAD